MRPPAMRLIFLRDQVLRGESSSDLIGTASLSERRPRRSSSEALTAMSSRGDVGGLGVSLRPFIFSMKSETYAASSSSEVFLENDRE